MRDRFEAQLKQLHNEIIEMGSMCQDAISCACRALEHNDKDLALKIYQSDSVVDKKEREIESLCLSIILHQQPIASDLNVVSATLKMITDLERIADQASDICEIVMHKEHEETLASEDIRQMGLCVIDMVHDVIEAYIRKDVKLSEKVLDDDDKVDDLFFKVKNDLIEAIRQSDESYAHDILDILMIAKYLERIGDHACNVAQWVIFAIKGEHNRQID